MKSQQSSILASTFLPTAIVVLVISMTSPQVQGKGILDEIFHFKEKIVKDISGIFDKDKCDCPCREYYVPKCEMTYVQQCHMQYYEEVCESVPVYVTKRVTETDCQRCRKYYVTVPTTEWIVECNPVYDEHCKTQYQTHCTSEERCVMVYQTVCDNVGGGGGYGPSAAPAYGGGGGGGTGYGEGGTAYGQAPIKQQCKSEPRQHCYPETKCHKTPQTECTPVKKENCNKVERPTTKQEERKECLPYEMTQAELEAKHAGQECPSTDYGFQATSHEGGLVNSPYGVSGGPTAPTGPAYGSGSGSGGGGNSLLTPSGYGGGGGSSGHGGSSSSSANLVHPQQPTGFSVDANDPYHPNNKASSSSSSFTGSGGSSNTGGDNGGIFGSGGSSVTASRLVRENQISQDYLKESAEEEQEDVSTTSKTTATAASTENPFLQRDKQPRALLRQKKMTFPDERNPFLQPRRRRRITNNSERREYYPKESESASISSSSSEFRSDDGWRPIFRPYRK